MKGYYIYFDTNSIGVLKKIEMQTTYFKSMFDFELIKVNLYGRNLFRKIESRLPRHSNGYNYQELIGKIDNPDFIYVRRPVADIEYINFFRYIKKKFPNCKVIIEVFTYPYDLDEYGGNLIKRIKRLPWKIKDKYYRKQLKYYVDRFVTYSDDDEIFGVKTIKTSNGTNTETILPRVPQSMNRNEIKLLSIAHMQKHHGYERIIKGMFEYYRKKPTRKVFFDVVGDGEVVLDYKKMVDEYKLSNYVLFHGKKTGEDLDVFYNSADIALASFGLYKIDIKKISALKTCEYMAKGLPIVSGSKISGVDGDEYFIKYFNNDDSVVRIEEIVDFYDSVYKDGANKVISDEISYCKKRFNMDVVMKPIIDYIIGDGNE